MRWTLRGRRGSAGGNAELDASLSQAWEAAARVVGKMIDLPAGKEALLANSGLSQESTTGLPAPAGTTLPTARHRRRRLVLGSAAVATLTAAAVVVAAIAVPGAGHQGTGASAVDTAYVIKRVDSALTAAGSGEVAQMTLTVTPGGDTTRTITAEEWSYGDQWRSVTNSPRGHPVYDIGFTTSSGYTVVSYPTRTWARQPRLFRPGGRRVLLPPGSPSCEAELADAFPIVTRLGQPGTSFAAGELPATVATDLRTAVSCGALTVAGRQHVGGTEAIELTSRPDSADSAAIWVNPDTYLPVRVVIGLSPAHGRGQPVLQLTADITWLKPTAQNLANLSVPIPAGFRHILFETFGCGSSRSPGEHC